MISDDELAQWLANQPLNEVIDLGSESVYLRVHHQGAELGAYLIHAYTPGQLQDALKLGFRSALNFDAGLGRSQDGNSLILAQWLPNVRNWTQAVEPLEKLLNQLHMWKTELIPGETPAKSIMSAVSRNEQRLRRSFAGAK